MNAWADGLNYYLAHAPDGEAARHHAVRAVDGAQLQRGQHRRRHREGQPRRSSRRSTARGRRTEPDAAEDLGDGDTSSRPGRTASPSRRRTPPADHALLLINPHTSFFFRAEVQMVSDEGLNAYGAVTWGQFFIYQGFNDRAGWMHTSSGVDDIDEYLETVVKKGDGYFYRYGDRGAPGDGEDDHRAVQDGDRHGAARTFTVYRTHHGPIVREAGRQVGERPADAGAAEGADAVVHAHQGEELQGVPRDDGAAHQLVEQHDLRRRRRQHRLLPRQLHPEARHRGSTGPSRWTAATRRPSGTACCRWTRRRSC